MASRASTVIAFAIVVATATSSIGAPVIGQDFPALPDTDGTGGLWQASFAVTASSYDRDDFASLGFSSLAELLVWDGRLDVSSLYGPWLGDGLSLDGRSTRQCVVVLFNGHPLTPPNSGLAPTLHAFSLSRLSRVEIILGATAGLYGPHGCEAVILLFDDAETPGIRATMQWRALEEADATFMIRRDVAKLKMSAGLGVRLFGQEIGQWKSFRDARADNFFDSDEFLVGPDWSGANDGLQVTGLPEAPSGFGYSYDFYYRARIGDVGLSWNQSTYASWAARGLDPATVAYGDRLEVESQESFYLTYVTDADDGSWRFFWNMSYALAEGSSSASLVSPMTAYNPGYSYRDEHRLTLEEYIQWELAPWATLFSGGGAGFGTLTPRSALLADQIDPRRPISIVETVDENELSLANQVSYRHLFGYGHLNVGDFESVVFQFGGRFDSDTREGFTMSPRASLLIKAWSAADLRLSVEYSPRPLEPRLRYIADRAEGQNGVLWTRPGDIALSAGEFLQVESTIDIEALRLSAYWRHDQAGPYLGLDTALLQFTPEFMRRDSLGWGVENTWKYRKFDYFMGYRGWLQRLGEDPFDDGHRAYGRLNYGRDATKFNAMAWAQYGDTVSGNEWSGGIIGGFTHRLDSWLSGLSMWTRISGGVQKTRFSTAADSLLPLPRANVDGIQYSWLVGLELAK